jgi:alkylation response protein AidB-like acyl-CoA dehydrogenase
MPVRLSTSPPAPAADSLLAAVEQAMPADTGSALDLAVVLGHRRAVPGDGTTLDQWEALATLAAHDLGAARAIEPHLDAVAILTQAGVDDVRGTWGVFAAEGGAEPLTARVVGEGWRLSGVKPWCSLAGVLDRALVTAAVDGGPRRLFAVDLRAPGVAVEEGAWMARGLREIPSGPVRFAAVPAVPVGDPGWYLGRPGFAWGGVGVAACWYGGAVGLARTIFGAAAAKPNPFLLAHLGAVDELLQSARRALAEAVDEIEGGDPVPGLLALRVRGTVARVVEEVLARSGHALGPAPLALDAAHAKRVADLQVYVRQHHAERDEHALGEALAAGERPW